MILEQETFDEYGYYPSKLSPRSSKKVLAVCDGCGKARVTTKHDYHYLCLSCAKREDMKGENHPKWKGGLVKRVCEYCGKEFEEKTSRIKEGRGRFCSRSCANKGNKGKKTTIWKGGLVKKICEACGEEFEVPPSQIKIGKGRFCSLSCANKGENHPSWKGGLVKRVCETCGKEFDIPPSAIKEGRGRFCSLKCHGEWTSKHLRGENSPQWQGGISFEPYCYKFDFAFKEEIREKFGRVCFLCPKTEAENGQRLSVHHVNYNKDCMCDGDLTCQFVPLCRSCNTRVNHNREEWEAKIMNMLHNSLKGWYI